MKNNTATIWLFKTEIMGILSYYDLSLPLFYAIPQVNQKFYPLTLHDVTKCDYKYSHVWSFLISIPILNELLKLECRNYWSVTSQFSSSPFLWKAVPICHTFNSLKTPSLEKIANGEEERM